MQSPPLAGISFPHVSHTPESILCFLPNVLIIKELPFAAAVFEIQEDGNVKLIQLISIEGEFPRDFTFNSDQKFVVAVNQNTNNATLYQRNVDTGKLAMIQKGFSVPEGTCVMLRK